MNPRQAFQSEYGAALAETLRRPEIAAALVQLDGEKVQAIADLTDEEIAQPGKAIVLLADIRGWVRHGIELTALPEVKKLVFQDLGEATYPSPEEEARAEELHAPENTESTAGPASTVFFHPEDERPEKPKATRRRKRPKRKTP